ncbi:MAG: biotin/lipoyl-binding protein [Planctomycetes bacterium]|nr:biotin/lipoyl-binding protein [Planctomycetota bacterium]
MIVKYLIPLAAVAGVVLATRTVIEAGQTPVIPPPPIEPARAPFESYIAAAGIVEASSENLAIATNVAGVITRVEAHVGLRVKAGELLFAIDDRTLRSELAGARAAVAAAQARVERLHALPRVEDLRTAEAKLVESDAALAEAKDQLELARSVADPRAISREELNRRRSAVDVAQARRGASEAQVDWQKTGAWKPDLAVAEAELAAELARQQSVETELARLEVRAPIDATILQVNARPGEYAPTGVLARPLVLLGDTAVLHVRADVDENDAWRFEPKSKAFAYLRGNRERSAAIEFVRVEPYVLPKRSLTGDSTERVDTRVLQVLYRFDPAAMKAYVGQQVDVFVEAPSVVMQGAR